MSAQLSGMPKGLTLEDRPLPMAIPLAIILVAAVVGAVVAWAAWARVDVVVQGVGRVIPSQLAQMVQSLEGGIVRELLVIEGDIVEQGQVVARIDPTRYSSELGEQQARFEALHHRIRRLTAEVRGLAELEPSDRDGGAAFAWEEEELFRARRLELDQSLDVIRAQIAQREDELREVQVRESRLVNVITLIDQEQAILAPLVRANVVPRLDAVRLQREAASLHGELEAARAALPRAATAIREARERLQERIVTFRSAAQRDLAEAMAQRAGISEALRASTDRLQRTEVRSPVRGVVNRLDLTTRGSVLQPGRTLMEITPLDDILLIEARVRPADVAQLRPGMAATVRLTAHDFALQGSLPGELIRFSSNTIQDEQGETFYRVVVQTSLPASAALGRELIVLPGMQGSVDLVIGTRSVADYLLKPITRMLHRSLRER